MLVVMELPRTRELLPRVLWRESSPSTNAELRELALSAVAGGDPLPHGTLLVTDTQTAGRGRLDRGWETPPGRALAASLLVRGYGEVDSGGGSAPGGSASGTAPDWGALGPAWLPLIAGSAVRAAFQPFFSVTREDGETQRVGTKWPNRSGSRLDASCPPSAWANNTASAAPTVRASSITPVGVWPKRRMARMRRSKVR